MFIEKLHNEKIKFRLDMIRDSILIEVSVPNQMWEIEFMADGTIEIEKFISIGEKFDEWEIDKLINEFSEENFDPN